MKFYIDGDDEYPTICGTGMEDYFRRLLELCKAGGRKDGGAELQYAVPADIRIIPHTMSGPASAYHNDDTLPQRGFYRWHILDPILFAGRSACDASADRRLP